MGLREKKAARTRERMIASALALFERHGYDGTTMEQIAEHAEVGTTTLYRYFPTKDLLLVDGFMRTIDLARPLRERPAAESLDLALGNALLSVARTLDDPTHRIVELRRLIDESPAARAKLWDYYRSARTDLEVAVADRLEADPTSLTVRMTAGATVELMQLVDEISAQSGHGRTHVDIVRALLVELSRTTAVVPASPESDLG